MTIDNAPWKAATTYRADPSLHAKARVVMNNNGKDPLTMIFVGQPTALRRAAAGSSSSVTLPAGEYALVRLDKKATEDGFKITWWRLDAGWEYDYSFAT